MEDFTSWTTPSGESIQEFAQNYRNALAENKAASDTLTAQNRQNAYEGIMAGANTRGMMYSNFPSRSKIQYDTNTYYPSLIKNQQTYQTGLDTLRSNMTKYWNNIKDYEQKIADLDYQKYDFPYDFAYDFAYDW